MVETALGDGGRGLGQGRGRGLRRRRLRLRPRLHGGGSVIGAVADAEEVVGGVEHR